MRNFVQPGDVVTLAAPYDRLSGEMAKVGNILGVAMVDVLSGANAEFLLTGVVDVTALTADTGTVGTNMYWDDTNKRLTTTASTHKLAGVLTKAKGGSDTTARIRLNATFS